MKVKGTTFLKKILPILLGVFFVWYAFTFTSAEDRARILTYIKQADYTWVFISVMAGILSHLLRAWRWNLLLAPLGYRPSFINNLLATMVGYLSNLGIPRSGEFLRASTLSSYEDIPFEKTFGTIVAERIIDLIVLLLIVLSGVILQTGFLLDYFDKNGINPLYLLAGLIVALIFALLGLRIIRKWDHPWIIKIRQLAEGLYEGVTSILRMQHPWKFVFATLGIWFLYVFMFWSIKFSLPETDTLGIAPIIVGFTVGAFAITATNGGVGIYPVAVGKVLTLYGISEASADAFGWIMWTSQTAMVIVFGALSFLFLPLYNRKK